MLLADPDEFDPSILTLKRNQSESFEKSAPSKGKGNEHKNGGKEEKLQKKETKEEKKADGELDKKSYEERMLKTEQGEFVQANFILKLLDRN